MHTITPIIHPQLLSELPRFFGSLPSAMQELLHNSLRAGATRVDAVLSGDTFVLRDDGCGVSDPQILLRVAGSQWGEGMNDPARLGGKAILNPEWVRTVTYRSGDWQFSVTPTQFQQAQLVDVQPNPAHPVWGLEVQIDLLPGLAEQVAAAWRSARGYAHIPVTLNDEVIPRTKPGGQMFELTGATLYLEPMSSPQSRRELVVVREHFEIAAPTLKSAVRARGSLLAAAMIERRVHVQPTLILHSDSAVQPRLPDRSDLLPGVDTDMLIDEINATLDGTMRALFQRALPSIGEPQLSTHDVHRAASELAQHGPFQHYLSDLGYRLSVNSQPDSACLALDWNNDYSVEHSNVLHLLKGHEVRGTLTELLLNHLRLAFPAMPVGILSTQLYSRIPQADSGVPTLRSEHTAARGFWPLAVSEGDSRPLAALCDEIIIQDQAVPVGIDDGTDGPLLLLAGTPDRAEAYVRAHLEAVGGLLLATVHESAELSAFSLTEDHTEVSAKEAGEALLAVLIDTFYPERKAARKHADALKEQGHILERLTQDLQQLSVAFPDVNGLTRSLLEQLPQLEERRATEHHELITTHRLD
ncbi:hypothetical protein [Deinococcus ruber]|uniref:ATP-binding protein n=1 Tax=Deinococcus ruber TaxID=1848197 RepID=A0A918FHM2_9DEIO|nr:hypothetical protein [Deinococcus ruber]GGR37871.1 hypothetical protein GCM10008957_53950 [Deinococcus ruber]